MMLSTNVTYLSSDNQTSPTINAATLGTAQIRLMDSKAVPQTVRALVDPGSQINLITTNCVQRCGFRHRPHDMSVSGAGELKMQHRYNEQVMITVQLIIVRQISCRLPQTRYEPQFQSELCEANLADPSYNEPGQIDVLLGSGVWATVALPNIIRKPSGDLAALAQDTLLGWLICGQIEGYGASKLSTYTVCGTKQIDVLLQRFWESESIPSSDRTRTDDEQFAEDHFINTHSRSADGRYIVSIPIRKNAPVLGSSYGTALKRYYALERRLQRNSELMDQYNKFMSDYLDIGHMIPVTSPPRSAAESYYVPYHIINKKKFRVVFDASCSTSTGVSFNDTQLSGEKLQSDLGEIILRFRLHRFAITADIVKMFRQVSIDKSQWDFQRILWRPNIQQKVSEYWLTTVTWGMTSAGFNAVRALKQCALDENARYPIASAATLTDFYIDDFLSGSNDYQSLVILYKQMVQLLQAGGFELSKWATNNQQLATELQIDRASEVTLQSETGVLGMVWLPFSDQFKLKVSQCEDKPCDRMTKRELVSRVSQFYDPGNMFGPVILRGKILLQDLWKVKEVNWDDQLPIEFIARWKEYYKDILDLSTQTVPRWVGADTKGTMQWHIFADASVAAFGAVAFLRTVNLDGTIVSRLMTSKSKVAPIKQSTIPRLELMAAHLGCKLAAYIVRACQLPNVDMYFWSDSTIVIHWLNKDPALLKQYVSNRVSSILTTTAELKGKWQHVPGIDNPADLISRGLSTQELYQSTLWWNGPVWLQLPQNQWPQPAVSTLSAIEVEAEKKEAKPSFVGIIELSPANCLWGEGPNRTRIPLIKRFSTLNSTLRVTAFVLRFVKNIKAGLSKQKSQSGPAKVKVRRRNALDVRALSPEERAQVIGTPSPEERDQALMYWIGIAQKCHYGQELRACKNKVELLPNSPLRHFAPFLDDNGLLRVGGRLQNSEAAYDQKHQIFVPRESTIGELLIRNAHYVTMHGGLSVNKAYLRQRFWFPRIGMAIRQYTHRCPTCIRYSKTSAEQIMGQLPSVRVSPAEPFSRVGVDFAGPFEIRKSMGKMLPLRKAAQQDYRKPNTIKAWIVVYVCLVTKAVHLDVTTGLTVEEFLETFAKMTSRRGKCSEMWSDNGTTFVGANRELQRVLEEWNNKFPAEQLASLGTTWRYITPSAPFKGGIWEAGVKSVKHHLKRVVGKRILTHSQL